MLGKRMSQPEKVAPIRPAGPPPPSGPDNGTGVRERLAAIEAILPYLARTNDVTKLKVWILGGVLGTALATGLIAWVVERLLPTSTGG